MDGIIEKRAITLSWDAVCKIISEEIEDILGIHVQCKVHASESELWDLLFVDYRLPLAKLCQLWQAMEATPENWEEAMPDDGGTDVNDIGMTLAERLIGRHLGIEWEQHMITEECLWLMGVKDFKKSMPDQDKINSIFHDLANDLMQAIINILNFIHRQRRCMRTAEIHQVTPGEIEEVINNRIPLGLFLTREDQKWIAVDNLTADAWCEEFSQKGQAVRWLRGEFEVSDNWR